MITVLASLLLLSGLSWAETSQTHCSSVDLRTEQLMEIRNQKDVAWCYAFTAADLLENVYQTGLKISAAEIATNYNRSFPGRAIRGVRDLFRNRKDPEAQEDYMMAHQTGFEKVALERAMQAGHCSEELFPSEEWVKVTRTDMGWARKTVDVKPAMLDIYRLLEKKKHLTAENLPYYFEFPALQDPKRFLALVKVSDRNSFYSRLRTEVCRGAFVAYPERHKVKMNFRNSKLFTKVDAQLDQGRLVSLDYDSRILKDRNNSKISLDKLHTSLIVGRRWNESKKSCEYLVRDSYGNKCQDYDASYECLGGQVWIPGKLLLKNATSIVYILTH